MFAEHLLAGEPFFRPDRNKPGDRPPRRETRSVWQLITSWLFTPKESSAQVCCDFIIQMKSLPPREHAGLVSREEQEAMGLKEEGEAGLKKQEATQMEHDAERTDGYDDHLVFDVELDGSSSPAPSSPSSSSSSSSSPTEDFFLAILTEDFPFSVVRVSLSMTPPLYWDDPLFYHPELDKLRRRHHRPLPRDSKLWTKPSKDDFNAMREFPDAPGFLYHKNCDVRWPGIDLQAHVLKHHPMGPTYVSPVIRPFVEDVCTAPQYGKKRELRV